MKNSDLQGVYTALITPFHHGEVDGDALKALVQRQVDAGVNGIVAVGTTGESPTLSPVEHLRVIELILAAVDRRVPVIAGTGANATAEALHLTREAEKLGVDGFLQVAPYYNKPDQTGLRHHFAAIAEATGKPIILYSIPGRCGIEIGVETAACLYQNYPHVCAMKEAGGRVQRVTDLRLACGPDYRILCGDDGLTLPFMALGAHGVISVASNLCPGLLAEFVGHLSAGRIDAALPMHERLQGLLNDIVFLAGNPVTIKSAMLKAGLIQDAEVRSPLALPGQEIVAAIAGIVQRLQDDGDLR